MRSFCFFILCLVFCTFPPADAAAQPESKKTAVFVGREIRPFVRVSDGIRERIGQVEGAAADVFYLDRMSRGQEEDLSKRLSGGREYAVYLAVGPEAAEYVWSRLPEGAGKVYAAILNPENHIPGFSSDTCGVSLNIPASLQLESIRKWLPKARRIGLLFDPENSGDFYRSADKAASETGLKVLPLRVKSRKHIPDLLEANLDRVDTVWMIPDPTVISETIIQYIIKTCLIRNRPVVGFNRFFCESGAGMCFVFDYFMLGRQAGEIAAGLLEGEACISRTPKFRVWLNKKVYRRLDMELPRNVPSSVEVKP